MAKSKVDGVADGDKTGTPGGQTQATRAEIWKNAVEIPIEKLREAPWNTQEMDDKEFNELVVMIEENEFDEPLQVIQDPDASDRFIVVGGNHRLKACRLLDFTTVPCTVKNWTLEKAKVETFKRNAIRGRANPQKVHELILDLNGRHGLDLAKIQKMMGIDDKKRFQALLELGKIKLNQAAERMETAAKKQNEIVKSVTWVVREILNQFGATVPYSYLAFTHKGKGHVIVRLSRTGKKVVDDMIACLAGNTEINNFLVDRLGPLVRDLLKEIKDGRTPDFSKPEDEAEPVAENASTPFGP